MTHCNIHHNSVQSRRKSENEYRAILALLSEITIYPDKEIVEES